MAQLARAISLIGAVCFLHGANAFAPTPSSTTIKIPPKNYATGLGSCDTPHYRCHSLSLKMSENPSSGDYLSGLSKPDKKPKWLKSNSKGTSGSENSYLSSLANRPSLLVKIRKFFLGSMGDRKKIANMGVGMALAYTCVSNISGIICVSLCWYGFSMRTGVSPLAKGRWPSFLATYAGFYAFLNIIRPARFALAVAIAPKFDALLSWIQKRLDCNRPMATTTFLFFSVLGNVTLASILISVASVFSGVPVWAGR